MLAVSRHLLDLGVNHRELLRARVTHHEDFCRWPDLLLLCLALAARMAALQTEHDGSTTHKTLRNGVVMPTIAAGTGGYDNQNQQGKVLRNGLVMPTMSAGTWQYDDDEAEASVQAALTSGFRHIDTAYDYGNQAGVSKGLAAGAAAAKLARKDIFITTKVPGCGINGVDPKDCEGSTLSYLQKDYALLNSSYDLQGHVDLVLLHSSRPCLVGQGRHDAVQREQKDLLHGMRRHQTAVVRGREGVREGPL